MRDPISLAETSPAVELRAVQHRLVRPDGMANPVLRDFDLTVRRREFCCVVGPTGCGKSTTLGLIAGLAAPAGGTIRVMGRPVAGIPPEIGFVFQNDALFPWRTVLANVAAGPLFRGVAKDKAQARARDWILRVGLSGFELHRPHQLSGGMRKRVALAQTLINNPAIILMDEPFSALDVQTREMMQAELLKLWSLSSASIVFVTHDIEEAVALGDKVVVLTAGPATVKAEYRIDLPRPRALSEIRYTPRFIDIARTIAEDLRAEVSSHARRRVPALGA